MAPGSSVAEVTVTAIDPDATDMAQLAARTADGDEVEVHAPPEYLPEIEVGDAVRVIVLPTADLAGAPPGTPTHVFVDFVRGPPMLLLAGVMAVLVVAVARLRGAAALLGLGLSLAGLAWFTLPALIAGRPAAAVAVVSATGIMVVVLYLVHGFSARTSTALVGTVVGILLTAGIGAWATGATHLTGLGGENSLDLLQLAPGMSLSGVLLCGLVLAGLGVLNDVTITQASAVWELRASSPTASRREVFARAMRIGRDHIASTVYTVAFAYVGAALPLVLLVAMSDRAVLDVLSAGEVAEEIVRTLVGSIGLVLAIPVTTALGALVAGPGSLASADDVVEDREAVEV
ncbi:YibE/F family protein [Actinotalea ferrariae]|nr:YibE/F family protein [Actinotalea ferrariae]